MKRAVLAVTGVLACPCHLPLWLGLVGGTALGGVVASHRGWVLVLMTAPFVGALALAFAPNGRRKPACLNQQATNDDTKEAGSPPPERIFYDRSLTC